MTTKEKITVYTVSETLGNIIKREGYLIEHGLKPKYAQYNNVPYIEFIIKGKRKPTFIIKGYNPFILILKGWDQPNTLSGFNTYKEGTVIISKSLYSCFDKRYILDFNDHINKLIKEADIIADYRYIKGGY